MQDYIKDIYLMVLQLAIMSGFMTCTCKKHYMICRSMNMNRFTR